MGELINVERQENIAIVTMNRPPVNAVTPEGFQEIVDAFDGLGADKNIWVVILRSAFEKYFCAGNEVKNFQTMTPENGHIRHRLIRNAFFAVYDCAVPVIAAVDGYAMGTGLGLAACCDMIVATEDAKFGAPELNVGVLGNVKFTRRLVPEMVMRRMLLKGKAVSAAEMAQWGAIAQLVPRGKLMEAAMEEAVAITEKAPSTVRLAKELFNRIEYLDFKQGFEIENYYSRRASAYEDSKEAQRAFMEKRKPVFTGR